MTRPTIRILLPPQASGDSYQPRISSPQLVRSYRSSPSVAASSPSTPTHVRSPSIVIRTRPSYKEDKHWQDSRPTSSRSSAHTMNFAAPTSPYPQRSSWSSRSQLYQHPDPGLPVHRQPPPPEHHHCLPSAPSRYSTAPPPPRSSISSASSAASAHSRRSSSSSDYLYGEDFAYGTGPLYVPGNGGSSADKTEAALAAARAEITAAKQARRRVRFV
jgi:hypothetical protein